MASAGSMKALVVILCIAAGTAHVVVAGRIDDGGGLEVMWGGASVSQDGQVISLSLDRSSGSGFRSRDTYLYARIDLQIKLVPQNSAGTVATCYVSVIHARPMCK